MIRCSKCVMPSSRPDVPFADGVCAACTNYANRPTIDWVLRKQLLIDLLDRHHGECIVPSSGGKDSTYQVLKLLELGAHVTVVTARTCHLTTIGRANIDNLARYARTIEVVPNMTVAAKLNRLGLEMVGDISWREHAAIFSTPLRVACEIDVPLVFYGENPQNAYGGPQGTDEALQMTRRWTTEFGGFLGLRPQDLECMTSERSMRDYMPPKEWRVLTAGLNGPQQTKTRGLEAHFLGQYLPWDSHENARIAKGAGMRTFGTAPTQANYWTAENLDNAQTGIHDYMMFRKYGYGRGCTQISVDIRAGEITREKALEWVKKWDGHFPQFYMGVPIAVVLDRIEMKPDHFHKILDQFTNWELFRRVDDRSTAEPILIA